MTNAEIGKTIREIRIQRGISQTSLSQMLGKNNKWLSRRETGKVHITVYEFCVILKLLHESVDSFFN